MSWLTELPHENIQCRSLRHAYSGAEIAFTAIEPLPAARRLGFNQHIARTLTCLRCGAKRVDFFSRRKPTKGPTTNWVRIGARYVYPEGYRFDDPKHSAPSFEEYNNEFFRRMLPRALQ